MAAIGGFSKVYGAIRAGKAPSAPERPISVRGAEAERPQTAPTETPPSRAIGAGTRTPTQPPAAPRPAPSYNVAAPPPMPVLAQPVSSFRYNPETFVQDISTPAPGQMPQQPQPVSTASTTEAPLEERTAEIPTGSGKRRKLPNGTYVDEGQPDVEGDETYWTDETGGEQLDVSDTPEFESDLPIDEETGLGQGEQDTIDDFQRELDALAGASNPYDVDAETERARAGELSSYLDQQATAGSGRSSSRIGMAGGEGGYGAEMAVRARAEGDKRIADFRANLLEKAANWDTMQRAQKMEIMGGILEIRSKGIERNLNIALEEDRAMRDDMNNALSEGKYDVMATLSRQAAAKARAEGDEAKAAAFEEAADFYEAKAAYETYKKSDDYADVEFENYSKEYVDRVRARIEEFAAGRDLEDIYGERIWEEVFAENTGGGQDIVWDVYQKAMQGDENARRLLTEMTGAPTPEDFGERIGGDPNNIDNEYSEPLAAWLRKNGLA